MEHPGICPHCGAEVPEKAAACTICGSDSRTGWSDVQYDDSDGMDDDEYADALRRTFGNSWQRTPRNAKNLIIGAVALGLIVLFALYYIL